MLYIYNKEYKTRRHTECMETITVEIARCRNCQTIQWPQFDPDTMTLVWPKTCKNQKCRSPYWNKERIR